MGRSRLFGGHAAGAGAHSLLGWNVERTNMIASSFGQPLGCHVINQQAIGSMNQIDNPDFESEEEAAAFRGIEGF